MALSEPDESELSLLWGGKKLRERERERERVSVRARQRKKLKVVSSVRNPGG